MEESVKTLGACTNPRLNWNDEHEHIKNKLIISIKKIIRSKSRLNQAHIHFNMHMLTNVYVLVWNSEA